MHYFKVLQLNICPVECAVSHYLSVSLSIYTISFTEILSVSQGYSWMWVISTHATGILFIYFHCANNQSKTDRVKLSDIDQSIILNVW